MEEGCNRPDIWGDALIEAGADANYVSKKMARPAGTRKVARGFSSSYPLPTRPPLKAMYNERTIEFCGEMKWETDFAILVFDGSQEVWIAKSAIRSKRRCSTPGDWIFEIPENYARKKEII